MTPAARAIALVLAACLAAACTPPGDKAAGHLKEAQALLAKQDYARARLEAKSALQIEPKNGAAHLVLAQIAWRDRKFDDAFAQLQMAVEGDPKLLEARLRLGDLLVASGDAKGAREQAQAAMQLAPERADVLLLNGKALAVAQDFAGAAKFIDAALAADPQLVDAWAAKSTLRMTTGDAEGALATLDEGIGKLEGQQRQYLREFRLSFLLGRGRFADYEAGLQQLIGEYPKEPRYRYQLLDFYTDQRRPADVEKTLRDLVELDPESPALKARLASALVVARDTAGAEKLLKDALAAKPDNADLQLALGDLYRYEKRAAEAMAAYRKVADAFPDTTAEGLQARNRIVAQYTLDGDIAKARAAITDILKAAPDNPEALLARATFSFLERRYADAIADLRVVLRRQKSEEALMLLARSYVGAGDAVVAKDTYRRLLEDYPDNADATRELAILLSQQGDRAQAAEILRKFLAVKPGDVEASKALVQNLIAAQNVEAAEAEARRMVESGAAGDEQLGSVLLAKGSNAEAAARYQAVLARDPKQADALQGLVTALMRLGKPAEAIAVLERYPKGELGPSLLLGTVYATQGDAAAARQVFEQAVAANPGDGRPYLALASLSPQDSTAQVEALERGWKAVPGNPEVGVFLAGVRERQGRHEEAIAVYEQALKQAPDNPLLVNNLASMLLDHKSDKASHARALELAKQLSASTDAVAMDTLGWAYFRNGDNAAAVRQLERAVAADEGNADIQYHLGMAYAAAGNDINGRQHLERALQLGGDQAGFAREARTALAKLGR